MKPITYLIVLCLLTISCGVEEQNSPDSGESVSLSIEESRIITENESILTGTQKKVRENNNEYFESRMQWAAFLTAYTVFRDQDARDELINTIPQGGNSFELSQLFSPPGSFAVKFEEYFNLYLTCYSARPPCPETSGSFPDPPLGGNGQVEATAFEEFRDYLLEDNCLELYFPAQFVLESGAKRAFVQSIITTAHPLNNNPFNDGFKLFANHSVYPSEAVMSIDGSYIVGKNVIVVRPSRDTPPPSCSYDEIEVSDFTDFLCNSNCNG